jgi:hypothetical protein
VERGIVRQNVDEVKTTESRKQLSANNGLLEVLKTWKQTTEFSAQEDWIVFFSGTAWQVAVVVSSRLASVPQGRDRCGHRQSESARVRQLLLMA